MDKINKSQILNLILICGLLIITPILSSSIRTTYLYFVVNLLIIALGVEAGLLPFFSKDDAQHGMSKKICRESSHHLDHQFITTSLEVNRFSLDGQKRNDDQETIENPNNKINNGIEEEVIKKVVKCGDGDDDEKINNNIKKCASITPSLFFIGDNNNHEIAEEEGEEEEEIISGQELYNKAETFIGNFYTQLKMQREESWKRLQDIYYKSL